MKNLLAQGADINARDQDGSSSADVGGVGGHTASVEALLAQGADINARNKNGMTALMWAASGSLERHTACVEVLLAQERM